MKKFIFEVVRPPARDEKIYNMEDKHMPKKKPKIIVIPATKPSEAALRMYEMEEFERKFKQQPQKGWKDVTRDDLMYLYLEGHYSDRRVAENYGVTINQVRYKKKKMKINKGVIAIQSLLMGRHPDIAENFWKNVRMIMDEKKVREMLQHNEDLSV